MKVLIALGGFLLGVGAMWMIGPIRSAPELPTGYYDLSALPEELAQKFEDPAFIQAFIKEQEIRETLFAKRSAEEAARPRKTLPDNVPDMPFGIALYEPKPGTHWPKIEDAKIQSELDAHKNDWVILNYWGTWCAPCVRELPDMDAAADPLAEAGVNLLVVNVDILGNDSPESVAALFAEKQIETISDTVMSGGDIDASLLAAGMARTSVSFPHNIIYAPGGRPFAYFEGVPSNKETVWNSEEFLAFFAALSASEAT